MEDRETFDKRFENRWRTLPDGLPFVRIHRLPNAVYADRVALISTETANDASGVRPLPSSMTVRRRV
jgi:hypothetical protein